MESDYVPGQRRPGFGTLVFVSALTSAVVSLATVYVGLRSGVLGALVAPVPAAEEARVPELLGLSQQAADELLAGRRLRLVVRERRNHDVTPEAHVIEQNPLAQSRVQAGAEVAVVLSMGPAKPTTTRVPEIVGKPVADAEALLKAAGLRVERVSPSEQGEPGIVAAVVPDVGTTIDVGAGVVLSVAERKVKVPRLLDEHIHEARERLAKAGLKVGDVSEIYDSRRRGNRVLNQDPEAGTLVAPGTEVKLVVNQGD